MNETDCPYATGDYFESDTSGYCMNDECGDCPTKKQEELHWKLVLKEIRKQD
jgi:hypothetical protein